MAWLDPMRKPEKREWPEVGTPEPMGPEELEQIRYQLAACYGRPTEPVPVRILAPAVGVTDRQMYRWTSGEVAVNPAAAKLLRHFVAAERIY